MNYLKIDVERVLGFTNMYIGWLSHQCVPANMSWWILCIFSNPFIANQRVSFVGVVPIPAPSTGPTASFPLFVQFIDDIGIKVGTNRSNFVLHQNRVREPGYFGGVTQHTADLFETELNMYAWTLRANQSAGKLYKVSPSGPPQLQL